MTKDQAKLSLFLKAYEFARQGKTLDHVPQGRSILAAGYRMGLIQRQHGNADFDWYKAHTCTQAGHLGMLNEQQPIAQERNP